MINRSFCRAASASCRIASTGAACNLHHVHSDFFRFPRSVACNLQTGAGAASAQQGAAAVGASQARLQAGNARIVAASPPLLQLITALAARAAGNEVHTMVNCHCLLCSFTVWYTSMRRHIVMCGRHCV